MDWNSLFEIIQESYVGYWNYLKNEILFSYQYKPWYENYFYGLVFLSLATWSLEIVFPWRKNQALFRKDFWLDLFYVFFNFFLFSLVLYNALSNVGVAFWNQILSGFGFENIIAIQMSELPKWVQYFIMFIIADFIQWNVHRMLHRVPWMWNFHKVHHSVEEMGFAAHLRFHWMETIIYKTCQYIPLAMIGVSIEDFFIIHMIALSIGHLNHANLNLTYGPFKYILNNPVMHLWHHAKQLPAGSYGVNYGLSLSLWDYIFKTNYIPKQDADVVLGFEDINSYPTTFLEQMKHPFLKNKSDN